MGFQFPSTLFPPNPATPLPSQDYLTGIRGLLVIQSFLWVFLSTFLPTAVVDSRNPDGRLYQVILRKTLSVLAWNPSLIYSSIIFLSARTICLPFLKDPDRAVCASSIFRRGIRLWLPVSIALGISSLIFSRFGFGTAYITSFLSDTGNMSLTAPRQPTTFLNFFNSLYDIFWVTKDYASQAANTAFPGGTLWIVSLLFQQSYTVYMSMITIPFTRHSWRVKAFLTFIATAWWVQSWAWYSISGLLLADAVMTMDFRTKSYHGWQISRGVRLPSWIVYTTMMVAGLIMQYLFIAWRPEYRNAELKGHTGLYNAASLNGGLDLNQPQARDDNYLLILGFFLLVETYEWMQSVLRASFLVYFGRRSFSYFSVQSVVIFTAGIKLSAHLQFSQAMSTEIASLVCVIICIPLVALSAEVFYRVVDYPSQAFAKVTYEFIRR